MRSATAHPNTRTIAAHGHLSVLLVNPPERGPDGLTGLLGALGHEVVVAEPDRSVAELLTEHPPDVVLIGADAGSREVLREIVEQADCPVIAIMPEDQQGVLGEAARHGVFGYVSDCEPEQVQGAIDIALERFADYQNLERALVRRATIERAKGILMERHSVDERQAFELLRAHARRSNRKVLAVAAAVVEGHRLLPSG